MWSALGIVYVLWGGTYVAIRVMVEDVPPLLGAGLRFAIAGVAMLAFLAARGRRSASRRGAWPPPRSSACCCRPAATAS